MYDILLAQGVELEFTWDRGGDIIMESVLLELSKASPYAVLLVLGFFLFYNMHKHAMSQITKSSERAIEEIRKAYKDAYKSNGK